MGDFVRALHQEHGVTCHLGDTVTAIDGKRAFRDAVLTPKAVQHDTDLLLGRILLAGCSPNVLHNPLGRRLLVHGSLSHLHSLMVTMSQKSSFLQPANSVSQVLIPDTTSQKSSVPQAAK
jgi:hypothetical protein